MIDHKESIYFENGGHVDFNHIDNRTFYRIIRHEWVGSLPSNPDIQNVDRTYAEGLVIDVKHFKEDMGDIHTVEEALAYLSVNKTIATNSITKTHDSIYAKTISTVQQEGKDNGS